MAWRSAFPPKAKPLLPELLEKGRVRQTERLRRVHPSPYELLENGERTGIVELPVEWIMDDAPLFSPQGNAYSAPRDVARVWMDEFDKAYDEGTMFLLTMHPHISGHRSRVAALELLIAHIKSRPGVWFATHRAAAEYVRKQM